MPNDPDPDVPVTVTTGEVRVGKTFEADRFPVPAIALEIESLADEPVRIRLVDDIPESFSMERVGFHPDHDGDNWTAYRDNRVAYERTLDPGESVLTVYGIRIDDADEAEAFLSEPSVELIEHGDAAATGDVLGRETTQVVRDALSGGEDADDALSGLASGSLLDDDAPAPRDRAAEPTVVTDARDESVTAVDVERGESGTTEDADAEEADADAEEADADAEEADADAEEADDGPDTVPSASAAAALDPRSGTGRAASADGAAEADPATESDSVDTGTGTPAASDTVAATLAAEIRAGTVDDDDLAVLRDALGTAGATGDVPTSVDVRIGRLQSQIEDLLAYRDALGDFLDENGTAEEVVGEVTEELHDLTERVGALEEAVADADAEREELDTEVATLADRTDAVADGLDDLEATVAERHGAVAELESDIADIQAELEELRSFRDRLNSAFGPDDE